MPHANGRLNEYGRNLAVERYLAGVEVRDIAAQLAVSRTTVYEWISRFVLEGPAGLADRSSRPHRSPRQVPLDVELQILQPSRSTKWPASWSGGGSATSSSICQGRAL